MSADAETAAGSNSVRPTVKVGRSRRFRLQFSLANLLFLTTIATLVVALWTSSRRLDEAWAVVRSAKAEVERAKAEVNKYRVEMGYLAISDPKKIYVNGMRTAGPWKWAWRVYLPKGRSFSFLHAAGTIPEEGFHVTSPGVSGRGPLPSGEFVIRASLEKDAKGEWRFATETPNGAGSSNVFQDQTHWLDHGGCSSESFGPGKMVTREPGNPVVLLRMRGSQLVTKPDGRTEWSSPRGPSEGVMIWIEEDKPQQKTP